MSNCLNNISHLKQRASLYLSQIGGGVVNSLIFNYLYLLYINSADEFLICQDNHV